MSESDLSFFWGRERGVWVPLERCQYMPHSFAFLTFCIELASGVECELAGFVSSEDFYFFGISSKNESNIWTASSGQYFFFPLF